jgi:hypothetical protein
MSIRSVTAASLGKKSKQLSNLEDRSTMMVFIGYKVGSKAWKFYNLTTRRVHVSHDVVFEEDRGWDWNEEDHEDGELFRMEYVVVGGTHTAAWDMQCQICLRPCAVQTRR